MVNFLKKKDTQSYFIHAKSKIKELFWDTIKQGECPGHQFISNSNSIKTDIDSKTNGKLYKQHMTYRDKL